MMRKGFVAILIFMAACGAAKAQPPETPTPPPRWDREVLDRFATLPVQDQGRVKPLDTFAQFTLLRLNGQRRFSDEDKTRMSSLEWLLNVLFYPESAMHYRNFLVQSSEAVVAIGIPAHAARRDRYSYHELLPGRAMLATLAQRYADVPAAQRSRVEQQILHLANNVHQFEELLYFFEFARHRFAVPGDSELAAAFPEADGAPLSEALARALAVPRSVRDRIDTMDDAALETERAAMAGLLNELERAVAGSDGLALFPPEDPADKTWRSPADIAASVFDVSQQRSEPLDLLAGLERLYSLRDDRVAFAGALDAFHKAVTMRAAARGEYQRIPLEVAYYRGNYMFYSQWLYVLSFMLIAVSWAMPGRRWLHYLNPAAVAAPTALLIIGITLRCIIRGRPPVTTLYETVLFCTAVAAVTALIIEAMSRRRIAVAVGSFLGAMGMFIANRYEAKEAVDTMPSLVAVLDTNFWLATHVTTIIIGYGACFFASALAHVYIFGRLLKVRERDPDFYPHLARLVYGAVCFGLFFSILGTVLGGIWANESWGRFWGWDPKENGALMIVLWGLALVHLRLGGHIRAMGISVGAVALGMITTFAWWGVNLLGVGLHSYGFTSGTLNLLLIFWAMETAVAVAGILVSLRDAARNARAVA